MGGAGPGSVHDYPRAGLLEGAAADFNVESGTVLLRAAGVRDVDGVNESRAVLRRKVVNRRDAGRGGLAVAGATHTRLGVLAGGVGMNRGHGCN